MYVEWSMYRGSINFAKFKRKQLQRSLLSIKLHSVDRQPRWEWNPSTGVFLWKNSSAAASDCSRSNNSKGGSGKRHYKRWYRNQGVPIWVKRELSIIPSLRASLIGVFEGVWSIVKYDCQRYTNINWKSIAVKISTSVKT